MRILILVSCPRLHISMQLDFQAVRKSFVSRIRYFWFQWLVVIYSFFETFKHFIRKVQKLKVIFSLFIETKNHHAIFKLNRCPSPRETTFQARK